MIQNTISKHLKPGMLFMEAYFNIFHAFEGLRKSCPFNLNTNYVEHKMNKYYIPSMVP
jgi:hypothetical protein